MSEPAAAPRPRQPRSDGVATRKAILAAARSLFVKHGYRRTTVRAIAERADVNPALVVRYFGGKEALFDRVARDEARHGRAVADTVDKVPLRRRGRALAERHMEIASRSTAQKLGEQLQLLLRSIDNPKGAQMLTDLLRVEYFDALDRDLAGPDKELRIALVQIQLIGLIIGRDVLKMRALNETRRSKVAAYLGASLQLLLTPPSPARE